MSPVQGLDYLNEVRDSAHVEGDWKALGRRVRERRRTLGYTNHREFADIVGVSDRTIGVLERGERPTGQDTLDAVEEALGWKPGSCRNILAGGFPYPIPDFTPRNAGQRPRRSSADIGALPDDALVRILDTLEQVHGEAAMLEALAAIRRSREGKRLNGEGRSTGTA